jgi:hypothetical protein
LDLLLDTHTFLWWLAGDAALSKPARAAIEAAGNTVFVSAASAWEIATKVRIGRLPGAASIAADLAGFSLLRALLGWPSASGMGRRPGRCLAHIGIRSIGC